MERVERKTHTIDATGKVVGRLASGIARLLQGKHKPAYLPHIDFGDIVEVTNVRHLRFTGKKLKQRVYYRHSGYPGSLKTIPMEKVFNLEPEEVLRRAVRQMLPHNKLQKERMKRLLIS